ncbi:hypothetical protein OCUBac02_45120 [Bosea sp. ANAM02]|nr:hypothetical protein OCUBac02_45120 [Bosea sp. ANAM02]
MLRMHQRPAAQIEDRRQSLEQRGMAFGLVRQVGEESVEPGEFVDHGNRAGRDGEIAQG